MATRKGKRLTFLTATVLVSVGAVLVTGYWPELVWEYRLWRDFESLGKNEQGYAEYRHRQTGIVLVSLPSRTFMMRSTEQTVVESIEYALSGEYARTIAWGRDSLRKNLRPEVPRHEVTVSPFLIGKYEVTQAQWKAVMGENPSSHQPGRAGLRGASPSLSQDELWLNLPVDLVSWFDCQDFCEKTRLSLPTEAQWEYACRAGTDTRFAGTGNMDEMGWWGMNTYGDTTQPVGLKRGNHFGIYDMHGNVGEWCRDVWDPNFYSRSEASGLDPLCSEGSDWDYRQRAWNFRWAPDSDPGE